MTHYNHVTDPVVRAVLDGDISEDAICLALTVTSAALIVDMHSTDLGIDLTVLDARRQDYEDADYAWNEEGDAAACVEALRRYWC